VILVGLSSKSVIFISFSSSPCRADMKKKSVRNVKNLRIF